MSDMQTVLLVDDEKDILDLLEYNLVNEGYRVLTARNGRQALELVTPAIDLVVLDVMMPEMDGFEVCRRLRKSPATISLPVLFLTAKSDEVDEIQALDLGADDYVQKPVSIKVLLARIQALLRRTLPEHADADRIELNEMGLTVDRSFYGITKNGHESRLPRKEFELLWELLRHRGKILSRQHLLDTIWGTDVFVSERTIDVHIRRVREKLGDAAGYLETVKGVGYRFALRQP
jgi:two-component system alkaline phosphatase synthesis response regulator PhoP